MINVNFKEAAQSTLGIGAGAVVSQMIGNKVATDMDPKIKGAVKIALGALVIPSLVRNRMAGYVGDGFIAEGALQIYNAVNVSGIEDTIVAGYDEPYHPTTVDGIEDDAIEGIDDEY
jgi:hypothetical protein